MGEAVIMARPHLLLVGAGRPRPALRDGRKASVFAASGLRNSANAHRNLRRLLADLATIGFFHTVLTLVASNVFTVRFVSAWKGE
jgi:hypothetical protein